MDKELGIERSGIVDKLRQIVPSSLFVDFTFILKRHRSLGSGAGNVFANHK